MNLPARVIQYIEKHIRNITAESKLVKQYVYKISVSFYTPPTI